MVGICSFLLVCGYIASFLGEAGSLYRSSACRDLGLREKLERFCRTAINFCKKKPKYKMKSFYDYMVLNFQSDRRIERRLYCGRRYKVLREAICRFLNNRHCREPHDAFLHSYQRAAMNYRFGCHA